MTCEALQRIMAPELEASRQKGELEGELRGKVLAYTDMGMAIDAIAERVSLSLKEIEEILEKM